MELPRFDEDDRVLVIRTQQLFSHGQGGSQQSFGLRVFFLFQIGDGESGGQVESLGMGVSVALAVALQHVLEQRFGFGIAVNARVRGGQTTLRIQ